MKKLLFYFILLILASCNQSVTRNTEKIITVSIPPFKYFIDSIGGGDFNVNIMVPAGSNPHIYEPVPDQIVKLRNSVAYISDGYLGFEMTWLDRFYETNPGMIKLSLGQDIDLIKPVDNIDAEHVEGADPHYWVSPKCALKMAGSVKSLLTRLNPEESGKYEKNYSRLIGSIADIDKKALELFNRYKDKPFMIFHPTLGYLARDYSLKEVAVENDGKEPNPSSMRALIDFGRSEKIKVIFIQKEYDSKNARAIASEINASLVTIDPLAENWDLSMRNIIDELYKSFVQTEK
jgi:zinc transport system substrate-binding protein